MQNSDKKKLIFMSLILCVAIFFLALSIKFFKKTSSNARDSSIITTMKQIRSQMEIYSLDDYTYGSSYYDSGIPASDGADPCNFYLRLHIDLINGKGGDVSCLTTPNSYRVATSLNNGDYYYCIDSKGFEGQSFYAEKRYCE